MKKSWRIWLVIVLSLTVVALAVAAYFLLAQKKALTWFKTSKLEENVRVEKNKTEKKTTTENLKLFRDEVLGLEISYSESFGDASSKIIETLHPFFIDPPEAEAKKVEGELGVTIAKFREMAGPDQISLLKEKKLTQYVNLAYGLNFSNKNNFTLGGLNKDHAWYELYERAVTYRGDKIITADSCFSKEIDNYYKEAGLDLYDKASCAVLENDLGKVLKLSGAIYFAEHPAESDPKNWGEARVVYLQNLPAEKEVQSLFADLKLKAYSQTQERKLLEVTGTHGPEKKEGEAVENLCQLGGGGLGKADFEEFRGRKITDSFLKEAREYLRAEILKAVPDLPEERLNLVLDVAEQTLTNHKDRDFGNVAVNFFNDMKLSGADQVKDWVELKKVALEKKISYADLQYLICQVDFEKMKKLSSEDIKQDKNGEIKQIDELVKKVKRAN